MHLTEANASVLNSAFLLQTDSTRSGAFYLLPVTALKAEIWVNSRRSKSDESVEIENKSAKRWGDRKWDQADEEFQQK